MFKAKKRSNFKTVQSWKNVRKSEEKITNEKLQQETKNHNNPEPEKPKEPTGILFKKWKPQTGPGPWYKTCRRRLLKRARGRNIGFPPPVPRSCVVRCSLHTFRSVLLGQKPKSPCTLIGKCSKLIHYKLLFWNIHARSHNWLAAATHVVFNSLVVCYIAACRGLCWFTMLLLGHVGHQFH
jgi:hypothetical protein